jgi:hypothetical protein
MGLFNEYLNENLQEFIKTFVIKKGNHFSWRTIKFLGMSIDIPHIGFTDSNLISFLGCFDKSCLYQLKGLDSLDISKLNVVSLSLNHMGNSARLGWRCVDGKNIELVSYIHDKSIVLPEQVLLTVKPDVWFSCKMIIKKDRIIYNMRSNDETSVVSVMIKNIPSKIKYILYPYFGGNNSAMQDMSIKILEK